MNELFENLLNKILNGEKITNEDWAPQSRIEEHLIACINETGNEGLDDPRSRAEELLQLLAVSIKENNAGSGSGGQESTNLVLDYINRINDYVDSDIQANGLSLSSNYDDDYRHLFSFISGGHKVAMSSELNGVGPIHFRFPANRMFYSNYNVTDLDIVFDNCYDVNGNSEEGYAETDYSELFNACGKLEYIKVSIPTPKKSNADWRMQMMFCSCYQLKKIILDCSYNDGILNIGDYGDGMFRLCRSLHTIEGAKLSIGSCSQIFDNCVSLQNIQFHNISENLVLGSGTDYGHQLTIDSLLSACNACKRLSNSRILTVGSSNLAKLANIYVRITDDTDTYHYPMVQCKSTDNGAMTVEDYMTLKNWSLA